MAIAISDPFIVNDCTGIGLRDVISLRIKADRVEI